MKQVFVQSGKAVVKNVPLPMLDDYTMLVRVHYSFISSGTESAYLGATQSSLLQKAIRNPLKSAVKLVGSVLKNGISGTKALIGGLQIGPLGAIGYSCSGQVYAVGSKVEKFRVGDIVACAGAGIAHHADVVAVPENLAVKLSNAAYTKQASLTTIGAIALQGFRRADLRLGETVCVIGLGLLGQLTVQLAKRAGCTVIGTDVQVDRVELAKKLGADYAYVVPDYDIVKEIQYKTEHYGVDATIITASSSSSGALIQQAMEITRRRGKVVLVGDVKIDFDRSPFYAKEIDFLISCSYGPGRYDSEYEYRGVDYPYAYVRWTENRNMQLFVNLLEKGELQIDQLISRQFSIDNASQAYDVLQKGSSLGLVLSYRDSQEEAECDQELANLRTVPFVSPHIAKFTPYVPPQDQTHVAVIGAGGFAKVMLLPLLKDIPSTKIDTIIDADTANALNLARQYNVVKTGNMYASVCSDEKVHAVIIATPHAVHAEQAHACISSGKAVFLEKPAAVTYEQFELIKQIATKEKESLFCVDFNRSWASFMRSIKKAVSQRTSPIIVHYRMNAGFIPKSHWIQSPENRGRIIGEACHIFELFCFLTDANPASVSVESMQARGDDLLSNDNVTVQVRFEDGSCCTLLYTAVGSDKLAKERMEVFFDGKSIVMEDYKELKGFGLPSSFNQRVLMPDKGHEALMKAFFQAARNENYSWPIPSSRILNATYVSILVDELARKGGGYKLLKDADALL